MYRATMLTFQEQLELYPQLKEYFKEQPRLGWKDHPSLPWRVWVQQHAGGKWAKKDFPTYTKAFKFWKLYRNTAHDVSIGCRIQGFEPPGKIVKLTRNGQPLMVKTPTGKHQATKLIPIRPPADHYWCIYCRRFTIFTWFFSHHALRGEMASLMDPAAERCTVCGIRRKTGAFR